MKEKFSQPQLLLRYAYLEKLNQINMVVFDEVGIGEFSTEASVRSRIRSFGIINKKAVNLFNIKRQIIS